MIWNTFKFHEMAVLFETAKDSVKVVIVIPAVIFFPGHTFFLIKLLALHLQQQKELQQPILGVCFL